MAEFMSDWSIKDGIGRVRNSLFRFTDTLLFLNHDAKAQIASFIRLGYAVVSPAHEVWILQGFTVGIMLEYVKHSLVGIFMVQSLMHLLI